MQTKSFLKVDSKSLFVSEPNPSLFGNPRNDSSANWLKSRFHFSFSEFHNTKQNKFGVLRVLNDDLVQPIRGFGAHPHQNMEIVTFVVDGFLTHKDSTGTSETLEKGAVQFMTAGTGIRHSEANASSTSPLRFLQLWITPRSLHLPPNYGSYSPPKDAFSQPAWQHLVTDVENEAEIPVKINQDVNIYVAQLQENEHNSFTLDSNRQAYLVCIEGNVEFSEKNNGAQNTVTLDAQDAAEIKGSYTFEASAKAPSLLLLVEMKMSGDSRF